MVRTREERRKAFKKALIDHGMTARQFAAEQGVSEDHLHSVLAERRFSNRLMREIERLIAARPVAA
jgi:lambda repressor-like predicted transcriptional regulator